MIWKWFGIHTPVNGSSPSNQCTRCDKPPSLIFLCYGCRHVTESSVTGLLEFFSNSQSDYKRVLSHLENLSYRM